ncbi:transmembrane protein 199 isoform X1 [Chrysoperla carnea]|uniref:transmembrane protein 199 isoform X1 n=1 Tax=Chrysoperla carnea TaxID=189513 RepID=UPI001D06CF86|nr:transmembrane protein 199 isoform X1 [Chrysoperla carnea]
MQQPLTDTKLKIIPSESIIIAINSIDQPEQLTLNLRKFHKKFKNNQKNAKIFESSQTFLTTPKQMDLIESLRTKTDVITGPTHLFNMKLDENIPSKAYLEIEDLKCLKENLSSDGSKPLYELLKDCTIYVPQNEVIPRNEQLEERCVKLRARQKNLEYRAMTKNVDNFRSRLPEDTIAFQVKEINKQLIAVAQFIMSVLAGFAFGFLGVELAVGSLDFGFRLLLGIICALIIALAEIYFLAKKLNEYNDFLDRSKTDEGIIDPINLNINRKVVKPHAD